MGDQSISVIGLGLLGGAIAARLCELGWQVRGYDVDTARRENAQAAGVRTFDAAATAIEGATRILLSLPNSNVVAEVIQELQPNLGRNAVILDTTTGDPDFAVAQAEKLRQSGVTYVEANVVGSSAEARAGDITLLVAGDSAAIDACHDLFNALAGRRFAVGPTGSAARMKLVVNLVLGLNRAALAEGLSFAEKLDLPPALTLEVLQAGAAYSRAITRRRRGSHSI
jgi:3-hydroxyisobutyrate dehydrogenase-like beta-hydroxyacid dehydrogenase